MKKSSLLFWMFVLGVGGWIGFNGYHYFLNHASPELLLSGVCDQGHYSGDVACCVSGSHPYKVGKISVLLDNAPLVHNFSISKQSFEYPFTLNTKTLNNGKHTLVVKVVDGTFHKNTAHISYDFQVDNVPLQAAFVRQSSESRVFQGRTLHVQFQVNKPLKESQISLLSKTYQCFPEAKNSLVYETYVPIECEEKPNEYPFTVTCVDPVNNNVQLEGKVQVVGYPFKKQTLHVSAEKIAQEKAVSESQQQLDFKLAQLTQDSPKEKMWNGAFYVPTEVKWVATEFGVVRTTQEKGVYTHKAIDIANNPKSVIWATQDGKVVVKERYAYSGNTVVIDHGYGVLSLFFHLDSFADSLQEGQVIKKGNPIGKLGKTGYASGYHLHWEMRINNTPVDPMQWTKPLLA